MTLNRVNPSKSAFRKFDPKTIPSLSWMGKREEKKKKKRKENREIFLNHFLNNADFKKLIFLDIGSVCM